MSKVIFLGRDFLFSSKDTHTKREEIQDWRHEIFSHKCSWNFLRNKKDITGSKDILTINYCLCSICGRQNHRISHKVDRFYRYFCYLHFLEGSVDFAILSSLPIFNCFANLKEQRSSRKGIPDSNWPWGGSFRGRHDKKERRKKRKRMHNHLKVAQSENFRNAHSDKKAMAFLPVQPRIFCTSTL